MIMFRGCRCINRQSKYHACANVWGFQLNKKSVTLNDYFLITIGLSNYFFSK